MQIEDVRELKQRALAQVVQPIVQARAQSASRMSFAATAFSDTAMTVPRRLMALGIAAGTGDTGYRLAVRLQRQSLLDRPEIERLTRMANGEIDIRFVGRIEKRASPWQQSRQRPLLIGSSIGHHLITAGTLGAFVRKAAGGGAIYALSNNHVLGNENLGLAGDSILQPGKIDGGTLRHDVVGKLSERVRFKRRHNLVDCAIAAIDVDRHGADFRKLKGIGTLKGLGPDVDVGAIVKKLGRTTGVTHGRVTAIELDDVVVAFDMGNLAFDSQIEIEGAGDRPFSDGGDSGSLIVDDSNLAVGLLFAGTDSGGANGRGLTYANPINSVLAALKLELLS